MTKQLSDGYPFNNVLQKCQKEIHEVVYWVNRTIVSSQKFRGQCIRMVHIANPKEIEYYKPGKVFRFQNIISAWIPLKDKKRNEYFEQKYSTAGQNVKFYITSTNGSLVHDYIGHKTVMDKENGNTVLFPSGSEFLVCRVATETS